MSEDAGNEVTIFSEAIKLPRKDRNAYLDRVCGGDEILRRKVEALLSAHDRLGDFMEEPPGGSAQ